MRVAGYARVSTQEQAVKGLGLEVQRDKIRAYCYSLDWELVQVYEDAGVSGAIRRAFQNGGQKFLMIQYSCQVTQF